MTREMFSIGRNAGFFVTDGTLANDTAVWVARNSLTSANGADGVKKAGVIEAFAARGWSGGCILAPALAHYSIEKSADVFGLGEMAVIKVKSNREGRMDVEELRLQIALQQARNIEIVAAIAVCGATETGTIDPLKEIAGVLRQNGIWFHVDASWGGPLVYSPTYRHRVEGIEEADSVTICLHKMLGAPMGSSIVLFRDPSAADYVEKSARYIVRKGSADIGRYTMEGSRSGHVLYWDMMVSVLGPEGLAERVDDTIEAADRFAALIESRPGFRLVLQPVTGIVNYVYLPKALRGKKRLSAQEQEVVNQVVERIQAEQKAAGNSFVSSTTLHLASEPPQVVFRAVMLNPATTASHLQEILDEQQEIGERIEQK